MNKGLLHSSVAAAAVAAMAVAFANPAEAIMVSNLADAPASWAAAFTGSGITTGSQSNATLTIPGTWTVAPASWAGNQPPNTTSLIARSPFDDTLLGIGTSLNDPYIGFEYWAVGPNNNNDPAKMTFTKAQNSLSFLWGSVDYYNGLEFFLDSVSQGTVVNSNIVPSAGNPAGLGASYVTIFDVIFDEVWFKSSVGGSSINAFEFSNITSTEVPIPAALPMLGAAAAGLGFAGWRRRRQSAAI